MNRLLASNYVEWLASSYAKRFRIEIDQAWVEAGVAIIARHAARWGGNDDFVSLVAVRVSEYLHWEHSEPVPFLHLIERSADAVRHRAMRQAKKLAIKDPEVLGNSSYWDKAQSPGAEAAINEIVSMLEPRVRAVLDALLAGRSHLEIAKQLGVSKRTIYRALERLREAVKKGEERI